MIKQIIYFYSMFKILSNKFILNALRYTENNITHLMSKRIECVGMSIKTKLLKQ